MRRLGMPLLALIATAWLAGCARETPATDTEPDDEEQESMLAASPLDSARHDGATAAQSHEAPRATARGCRDA